MEDYLARKRAEIARGKEAMARKAVMTQMTSGPSWRGFPLDHLGKPVPVEPPDPPERFTPSKQTTEFRNNLLDVLERIHDRLDEIAHRD